MVRQESSYLHWPKANRDIHQAGVRQVANLYCQNPVLFVARPIVKGVPTGFTVPIREVRCSAGAGYLYALAAEIMTIPGLPTHAGFMNVEVNDEGEIEGLF